MMTGTSFFPGKRQPQGIPKLVGLGAALLLGASAGVFGTAPRTHAAEKLVFTFGAIGDSVEIAELQEFVETGAVPRTLRPYLKLTNTDPEAVRALLQKQISVNIRFLDKVLNTLPGEYGLFQLGTIIHTPTRQANIQALRAAVVLSASGDNKISLLEFLEKYPTRDVVIDGQAALKVAKFVGRVKGEVTNKIAAVERRLDTWLVVAQDLLQNLVCECEAEPTPKPDAEGSSPGR